MRVSFVLLVVVSVISFTAIINAQDQGQGHRRHGGNPGDNTQNGGGQSGGFQGGGPGGGYPGWGGPGGGYQGGGPGGFQGGGPGGYQGGGPGGYQGGGPGGYQGGGPGGYQGGGPGGFQGGGPGWGGPGGGSREERMAGFLQQFDSNRDGQIDAKEAQAAGPRAGFLEGMIRRAGLEPKYPIKLSTIQEGMQNARNNWNRGGPNGPPGGNPGSPPGPGEPPAKGEAKAADPPLVPGFGTEQKQVAAVPGFGIASNKGETVATASPSAEAAKGAADAPAIAPDQLDEKTRKFAESIMKQNDKDRNNSLEKSKSEWAELRNADAIDKDHNGVITLDELTAFYQAANGVRAARKGGPANKASATPVQPDSPPISSKPYRVLSPLERLPEGLPDWFARNDSNGDGQISMSEFAREWSSEKAAEYAHYDLNGDGIITPQECLQIEKKK